MYRPISTIGSCYHQGRARLANRRQRKQNGGPRSRNAPRGRGPIDGSDMTRREAADYIAALVDELKSIAQSAGSLRISSPWQRRRHIWNGRAKIGLSFLAIDQ